MATDEFYSNFVMACASKGIDCKIPQTRWLELKKHYSSKCDWRGEMRKCILWLYDNNKKIITTSRLRNWLEKAKPIQKKTKIELKPSPIDVALEPVIAGKNLAGFKPKTMEELMGELNHVAQDKQMSEPSYIESLRARADSGDGRAKHILRRF